MPRPNAGPRLVLYGPDTRHGSKIKRTLTRYLWYIVWSERGKKCELSTGAGFEDRAKAEGKFADFLASRALKWSDARRPDQVTIADVLATYGEERAPQTADPKRIAYCIVALVEFWNEEFLSAVTPKACRAYTKFRLDQHRSPATARKELGTLSAAINYCYKEGKLTHPVPVELPPKSPSKEVFFNRREIALLLKSARMEPKARAHLPPYILFGFYMGRRREALLKVQWLPNTIGGYADPITGLIDFLPRGKAETKKRRGKAPIPRHLMTFLRYLRRRTTRFVIEVDGQPVKNLKHSFKSACLRAARLAEERAAKAKLPTERDEWLLSAYRYRHASPHVLRHSCASLLMQRGIPFADIGHFIGMSVEMVDRTYGHLSPDKNERVLRAFERPKGVAGI